MKISIAQIEPVLGDIPKNIDRHLHLISLALKEGIHAIFFPELSITGYDTTVANVQACQVSDERFNVFQELSNKEDLIIGFGMPKKTERGTQISMLIFQANQPRQAYAKQLLDPSELPFFVPGDQQVILRKEGLQIAPAICYESLQMEHLENSIQLGADIYVASVANSQRGMEKAKIYFSKTAKEKAMPILLVNGVSDGEGFASAGQSTIWNEHGELIGELTESEQGLLVYDVDEGSVVVLKGDQDKT